MRRLGARDRGAAMTIIHTNPVDETTAADAAVMPGPASSDR
ncbi:hypothetical protein [Agromyces sp. Marseille-P2726]|nr:hypothetical protein [Agromyces sp. Marseille-P2726]